MYLFRLIRKPRVNDSTFCFFNFLPVKGERVAVVVVVQIAFVVSISMKILLPPRRYLVCALTFLGLFMLFAMRINLSIGIVAMTTGHPVTLENGTVIQVKPNLMRKEI